MSKTDFSDTALTALAIFFILAAIFGYVGNIVFLVSDSLSGTGALIVSTIGTFVPPLGIVMGWLGFFGVV